MRSQIRIRRVLCLWFPDWPLQRLVVAQPQLERCFLLLTEPTPRGAFVRHCNWRARKRGVRAGMPVAEARTFAGTRDRLVVQEVQPAIDLRALTDFALQCEPYSFCVGLEDAERPECLLMDVTGVAHFFGGERSLAEHLQQELLKQQFDGRIAIAETIGAAWGAAHFLARPRQPVVIPAEQHVLIESLPIAGLRLNEKTVAKLRQLGLRTIGQVLALDRAALVRRLGDAPLTRLDQLSGQQEEIITHCRPLPRYQIERTLEEGISDPESIECLWSLLLRQLLEQLQPRQLGTRRLDCRFDLENRTSQSLTLRLCAASNDPRHLGDLLRLQLERLHLAAPLIGLRMEALEVAPLEASQQEFFDEERGDGLRPFAILLNRLSSRLGEQAVVAAQLLPDPIFERAVRFRPVTEAVRSPATVFVERFQMWDRPTVLFSSPRPLEVIAAMPHGLPAVLFWKGTRFDIARHWGPERIESGWWQEESIRRDYYRVETVTGAWLWIFRRLQDQRWFWHGEL